MFTHKLFAFLSLFLLLAPTVLGETTPPSFMERDQDGNGRLTLVESHLSAEEFKVLDESANGELSLGEFEPYWSRVCPAPTYPDVSYGLDDPRQTLDLYLPSDAEGELPLVVWIHGGSWNSGSKTECPFSTLTSQGFAVASINYRLAPKHRFPAQLQDCRLALEWLRALALEKGLRFSKTTAVGLSAGGHLALLLGARQEVDGVISFGAPVDLTDKEGREEYRETLESLLGSPLSEEALRQASPSRVLTRPPAPVLLFHGLEDRRIPYTQALVMARAVAEEGGGVDLKLIKDGSHTVVGGPEGWRSILLFLGSPNPGR